MDLGLPKHLQQPEFPDLFGKTGNISVPEPQIFKCLYGLAIFRWYFFRPLHPYVQSIGTADAFHTKLVL
jgi:hypothetical protein